MLDDKLLKIARDAMARAQKSQKQSFVDPQEAAGAGAAPPGGGMAAMAGMGGGGGAAPPMDPAMAGGGGPPMAGGAPPPPPMEGGGGGVTAEEVQAIVQNALAAQGGGAGGGEKKMKVDTDQEIYQIKKLLVGLYRALDIPVEADTLLRDPATDPKVPEQAASQDPLSAASQGDNSSIPPIQSMPAAMPQGAGGGEGGGENKQAAAGQSGFRGGYPGETFNQENLAPTTSWSHVQKAATLAQRIRRANQLNGG